MSDAETLVPSGGTIPVTSQRIAGRFIEVAVVCGDHASLGTVHKHGHAADLLFDHCLNDWRDVIEVTRLPSLVVGGRKSIFSAESQEWIASVNPNARAVIFEEDEGGAHFMFYENASRFNAEVDRFLNE